MVYSVDMNTINTQSDNTHTAENKHNKKSI